jgi:hypothetical protein
MYSGSGSGGGVSKEIVKTHMKRKRENNIREVDSSTLFNLPLSEYPLVLDCRSSEEYTKVHIKIAWNVPTSSSIHDVFEEIFDEDPPEMCHKVILIHDDVSTEWATKVSNWLQLVQKNDTVERWRSSLKEIWTFTNVEAFGKEFPFLVVKDEPLRKDTYLMPYPNRVLPGLFIGSISHASEKSVLRNVGITSIVNSTKNIKNYFPDDFSYVKLNIEDDERTCLQASIIQAHKFMQSAFAKGGCVLVHCHQGKSRSASIVLSWMMRICAKSAIECLQRLQSVRSIVAPNPCFLRQLAVFDILGYENYFKNKMMIVNETQRAELKIESNWAIHLNKQHTKCLRTSLSGDNRGLFPQAFLISNVFSRDECKSLIGTAESVGFGRTQYPHDYRGNLRLITVDKSLSTHVWHRIRSFVPPYVRHRDNWWIATGLNDHWRLSKYLPLDRFQAHCDDAVNIHRELRSMFTVNIYMNDDFLDGNTRFYESRESASRGDVYASVKPCYGLALIFRQPPDATYLHDGERVRSGLKYLFRSDIFYTRLPSSSMCVTEDDVKRYLKNLYER